MGLTALPVHLSCLYFSTALGTSFEIHLNFKKEDVLHTCLKDPPANKCASFEIPRVESFQKSIIYCIVYPSTKSFRAVCPVETCASLPLMTLGS